MPWIYRDSHIFETLISWCLWSAMTHIFFDAFDLSRLRPLWETVWDRWCLWFIVAHTSLKIFDAFGPPWLASLWETVCDLWCLWLIDPHFFDRCVIWCIWFIVIRISSTDCLWSLMPLIYRDLLFFDRLSVIFDAFRLMRLSSLTDRLSVLWRIWFSVIRSSSTDYLWSLMPLIYRDSLLFERLAVIFAAFDLSWPHVFGTWPHLFGTLSVNFEVKNVPVTQKT